MDPYAHLKTIDELRDEGNAAFREKDFSVAVVKYRAALRKEQPPYVLRATLQCNICVALAKSEKWEDAIAAATACLAASPEPKTRQKALLHRSRAYRASPHRAATAVALATNDLTAALALDPANAVLRRELENVAAAPTSSADDDGVLPAPLLDGARLRGRDAKLYGADEAARRRDAPAPEAPRPPEEWVQARLADALARKRREAEAEAAPLSKGYVKTGGGEAPAWARAPATDADKAAAAALATAAPARVDPADAAAAAAADYNRGYKEVDVSTWALRRLEARLHAVQAALDDPTVRDGFGGVVRVTPVRCSGDALMVRVAGRWDRAYDLACRFDFEARLGAPRTKEVVVKGEAQRVFMGVPTVRGAVVVRELTHVDGPKDAVVDLEWGYGASEAHLEKDEIGMEKAHATALRALLHPRDGPVRAAVVAMLEAFVDDFVGEAPGEPKAGLNYLSRDDHARAVAALRAAAAKGPAPKAPLPAAAAPAPWRWTPPDAPARGLEAAPGSKLAELSGTSAAAPDGGGAPASGEGGAEGDARGGFSHAMMERFEALNKDGYTVLMGAAAPAPAPAPATGGLDYGRFDDLDTDSDDDAARARARNPPPPAEAVDQLDDDTQMLWDVIYNKIAGGDLAEARRLMAHPEEIEDHPLIRCLYDEGEA